MCFTFDDMQAAYLICVTERFTLMLFMQNTTSIVLYFNHQTVSVLGLEMITWTHLLL